MIYLTAFNLCFTLLGNSLVVLCHYYDYKCILSMYAYTQLGTLYNNNYYCMYNVIYMYTCAHY